MTQFETAIGHHMTQSEAISAALCPSTPRLLQNHTTSYNALEMMMNDQVFFDICTSLENKIYHSTLPVRCAQATTEIV